MPKPKNEDGSHKGGEGIAGQEQLVSFWVKAYEVLRPRWLQALAAVGALVVLLAGVGTWSWYRTRKAKAATRVFGEAMEILRAPVETPEQKAEPEKQADATTEKADTKKYVSVKERAEAALATLSRIEKEYGSTEVRV